MLTRQVVMFQADVDSWWNLSLGHAIPAFAPWLCFCWTCADDVLIGAKEVAKMFLKFWLRGGFLAASSHRVLAVIPLSRAIFRRFKDHCLIG